MGLYLCILTEDKEEEIDGLEIGFYADFGHLRDSISKALEPKGFGTRFPTLMGHHDSDGEWTPADCHSLRGELEIILKEAQSKPSVAYHSPWQQQVAKQLGLKNAALSESFIDVDGENILVRLLDLCKTAEMHSLPILFQ